jgi:hypothetical protein
MEIIKEPTSEEAVIVSKRKTKLNGKMQSTRN